jgi:hypothetical protein
MGIRMTITLERPAYAGRRRFEDREPDQRAARHRAADSLLVVVLASATDALRDAGSAAARGLGGIAPARAFRWIARMSARAVGVAIIAVGIILGAGALAIVEPSPAAPNGIVVTPSVTPYPDGWTYGG